MSLKTIVKAFFTKDSAQQDRRDAQTLDAECWDWPLPFDTLAMLPGISTWHARCIEVTAAAAVGVGFRFETETEAEAEAARKRLEDLAGEYGASDLFVFAAASLRTCGNGWWEFARNAAGEIAEWYPGLPQTFWVRRDGRGYKHRAEPTDTRVVPFRRFGAADGEGHELVHLRTLNLRHRHYGIPAWLAATAAIELDQKALTWNSKHFDNNAVPPWALTITGGEPDDGLEQAVENFLRTSFKGAENAGRLLYLNLADPNVKVEWQRLADEAKDGSYHVLRLDNRDEIIAAHGVPPRILGIMSAGSLGGGGEVAGQILLFDQVTLQPLREQIARAWNNGPGRELGLPPLAFERIDVTTGKEDADALALLAQAGIITPGEARGELGYGDPPAGDTGEVAKALERLEATIAR